MVAQVFYMEGMSVAWERMSEEEWRLKFYAELDKVKDIAARFDFVTGPGRSGAVAAVYASHYLSIPYKPHKAGNYEVDNWALIVDTVEYTGRTLRQAGNWYRKQGLSTQTVFAIKETKGHYYKMWYEA